MTVNQETEAEVLRLFHAEKWGPTAIATQLQLHHSTVQRVLVSGGVPGKRLQVRKTKADLFIPFILATLEKYPKLTAARLFGMVKERGYTGALSRFRALVANLRPRPAAEAYLRTSTLPGEQAQCDWAHFGKVKFGNAERRLLAFVMVVYCLFAIWELIKALGKMFSSPPKLESVVSTPEQAAEALLDDGSFDELATKLKLTTPDERDGLRKSLIQIRKKPVVEFIENNRAIVSPEETISEPKVQEVAEAENADL